MYSMMIVDFIFGSMYKVKIRIPVTSKIVDFIFWKMSFWNWMICAEKLKWKNRADINFEICSVFVYKTGVSIIFKNRVFYKAWFEGFEFFIVWPYTVFHKMQVVFYKSAHFMYLWSINSVFAKCDLQSSKILK